MDSDDKDLPVRVDIAAKAEAKLELRGEIPSQPIGRLLDALTDILRPFSEARGLKADQIRLRREDVLIEIAKRSRERLATEYAVISSVPLKFLVPFLEKASVEEPDGPMLDWWANLLASASQQKSAQHPILVEIMGRITSAEARFLDALWGLTDSSQVHASVSQLITSFNDRLNGIIRKDELFKLEQNEYSLKVQSVLQDLISEATQREEFFRYVRYPVNKVMGYELALEGVNEQERDALFEVCAMAGALERVDVSVPVVSPFIGEFSVNAECYTFTSLGRELMRACHR